MSDKMDGKLFAAKFRLAMKKINSSLCDMYHLGKMAGLDADLSRILHHYGTVTKTYIGYRYNSIEVIPRMTKELGETKAKPVTKLDLAKQESVRWFNSEVSEKIGKYVSYNVDVSYTHDKCGVTFNKLGSIEKITIHPLHSSHAKYIGPLGTNKVLVYAAPHKHDTFQCWKACFLTYKYNNGNRKTSVVDCFIMKEPSSGITYYHTDYRLCAEGMRRAIGRSISKRIGG